MNMAVVNKHIMQVVDWSRFDMEGWLYQFGAWMYSNSGTCGKSLNPIAIAMDNAVIKRKKIKLGAKNQSQIIADYLISYTEMPSPKNNKYECSISDDEARAVQRLVLDLQGVSDVMDNWLDAIICRYFYGNSWSQMTKWEMAWVGKSRKMVKVYSENDARADVKCGLAVLHCRYKFIEYR